MTCLRDLVQKQPQEFLQQNVSYLGQKAPIQGMI